MSGNSSQIDIDELASEVMKGLSEYNKLATSAMKKAVRKTANSVKKELETTSPRASGKYADSWIASSVSETSYIKHMTVWSKTHYPLVHLLENGHAMRNGDRVEGIPHVAPAEKNGELLLESLIKKELS